MSPSPKPNSKPVVTRRKPLDAANDAGSETTGTEYLESLLGYNAHRAALTLVGHFIDSVDKYELRTVSFSVLSVIGHAPGVTSRQLCQMLSVLPPNMVVVLRQLDKRGLIKREPHPTDGRAMGLSLTAAGKKLIAEAEQTAKEADLKGSTRLTAAERKTLANLLRKIYLP